MYIDSDKYGWLVLSEDGRYIVNIQAASEDVARAFGMVPGYPNAEVGAEYNPPKERTAEEIAIEAYDLSIQNSVAINDMWASLKNAIQGGVNEI